jgi:hypothetical protein
MHAQWLSSPRCWNVAGHLELDQQGAARFQGLCYTTSLSTQNFTNECGRESVMTSESTSEKLAFVFRNGGVSGCKKVKRLPWNPEKKKLYPRITLVIQDEYCRCSNFWACKFIVSPSSIQMALRIRSLWLHQPWSSYFEDRLKPRELRGYLWRNGIAQIRSSSIAESSGSSYSPLNKTGHRFRRTLLWKDFVILRKDVPCLISLEYHCWSHRSFREGIKVGSNSMHMPQNNFFISSNELIA